MSGIFWAVRSSLSTHKVTHHIWVLMVSFDVAVHPKFISFLFLFRKYSFHWVSLLQTLIQRFSSRKLFFAKSWLQDRAQKISLWPLFTWEEMGSFLQFPPGRRSALVLRNFLHHLMILPAGYMFCSFPSQKKNLQTFYFNKIYLPPFQSASLASYSSFCFWQLSQNSGLKAERNHTDSVVSRIDQCSL